MYSSSHALVYAYDKTWSRSLGRVFALEAAKRAGKAEGATTTKALRILEFGCGPAYASSCFIKDQRKDNASTSLEVWLEDVSEDQLKIAERHLRSAGGKESLALHFFPQSAFADSESDVLSKDFLDWLPSREDVDKGKGLDMSFLTLVTEYLSREQIVALLMLLMQRTSDEGIVFISDWAKHPKYQGKEAEGVRFPSGICKATWLSLCADVVRAIESEDEATDGEAALTAFEFPASQSSSSVEAPFHRHQPHHRLVASQDTVIGRRKARVRVELTVSDLSVTCSVGKESLEASNGKASQRERTSSSVSTASAGSEPPLSSSSSSSLSSSSSSSSRNGAAFSLASFSTSEDSPLADAFPAAANGAGKAKEGDGPVPAAAVGGHNHVRSASEALHREGASSRQCHFVVLKKRFLSL